jgi:uncharacterized membrane protein
MRKLSNAQRACVAAALLATVSITGAASASASAAPQSVVNTYECTGSLPELCFGVQHNGDDVISANVQAKMGALSYVGYTIKDPSGNGLNWNLPNPVGAGAWAPSETWGPNEKNGGGKWCAYLNSATDSSSPVVHNASICIVI